MKVAFFLGSLKRGGAESLIYDICRKRSLAPFSLCCLYRKENDYSLAFKKSGAELIQVERTGSIIKYILDLRKAILNNKIDIVHAQTPSNALVSILAVLFLRVRVVTTFHGFSFSDAPKWYWWIIFNCSKKIICVSEYQKQFYLEKWRLREEERIRVIYNGIDFSKFERPQPDLDRPVIIDKDKLNMIMVGSFMEGRSQYFICKVLHQLNQMGFPFNLFFAGRRIESEYWRYDDCVSFCEKNNLMDKVHFLGGRTDIPFLLRQMDLFIYASEHDTFGIAVIEALASGLPVLVNDWAVMKEITQGVRNVILYRTEDIDDCIDRIKAFIKKGKATCPSFSESIEMVRERYSIEKHICELNELYLSC